jgi:uncharacterized glyoxalase superfamily protein PhnB
MADPLDALRQPTIPLQPRAAFAAELRVRLEAELGLRPTPPGGAMSTTTASATAPAATQRFHAYLAVDGADRAIAWYTQVFGAVEQGDRFVDADNRVGHAEFVIGDVAFFISDEYPDYGVAAPDPSRGANVGLHLYVDDVDAVYARAVATGARGERDPEDQPYGDRSGTIRDPFGHRWQLATRIEDVSRDELEQRVSGGDYSLQTPPSQLAAGTSLDYFTLPTPDAARSAAFYGPLFGWELHLSPAGAHIANVSPPGGFDASSTRPKLYFRVEPGQLEAVVAKVRELGGTAGEINEWASGRGVACRDDQGVEFDLHEPAPGY